MGRKSQVSKKDADKIGSKKESQPVREFVFHGSVQGDLGDLPVSIRDRFSVALTAVQHGLEPTIAFRHLHVSKGKSAIELKINGRPAYRVVYTTKRPGKVDVVYAGKKTAQGTDTAMMDTVEKRLSNL